MKYDMLISDCDSFADAFKDGSNLIRINGLGQNEMEVMSGILERHGVLFCLFPYKE